MKVERYALKLKYLHPETRLREKQQLAVEYEQKLKTAMEKKMTLAKQRFHIYIEKMKGLSPLAKLNQGFSYVTDSQGNVVKSINDVRKEDLIYVYVTDGSLKAKVEDTKKEVYHGK